MVPFEACSKLLGACGFVESGIIRCSRREKTSRSVKVVRGESATRALKARVHSFPKIFQWDEPMDGK
jgi:hypothetical protein